MELNREKAIRAMRIAEKKMENEDFAGARKAAVKARQLYPDLENISRMICVCDVHCSAGSMSLRRGKDWYGILQVEHSANEISIKDQYCKLSLLLHPDKNKFMGAEAAFKLIGEAQDVLLDGEKRSSIGTMYRRYPQYKVPNNLLHANRGTQPQQQAQPGVPNGKGTFWTACPFCHLRFRYFKDVMNNTLRCHSCKKPFVAYDTSAQLFPPGNNSNQTATYTVVEVSKQGVSTGPFETPGKSTEADKFMETRNFSKAADKTIIEDSGVSNHAKKDSGNKRKKRVVESSEEVGTRGDAMASSRWESGGKRRGSSQANCNVPRDKSVSCNEETLSSSKRCKSNASCSPPIRELSGSLSKGGAANSLKPPDFIKEVDRSGTVETDENEFAAKDTLQKCDTVDNDFLKLQPQQQALPWVSNVTETFWTLCPCCNGKINHYKDSLKKTTRCHTCKKPFIAYDKSDRSGNDESGGTDRVARDKRPKSNSVDSVPGSNASPKIQAILVPDSDFSDFDQIRKIGCFKAGQIWALYDDLDAMPRLYVVIRKVFSSGFAMRITWLDADPNGEDASQWFEKDLPISCGKFSYGTSETTEDPLMFSHPISWEKGHGKKSIKIYPMKGETWAVFSNWQMVWKIDPDNHKSYEYDFVEILSDYDDSVGIRVVFLGKLKGFVCVFCQKNGDEVIIPPTELLRFSHRIPSYRLKGDERKGTPMGSFELDPASLPHGIPEIPISKEMMVGTGGGHSPTSDSRSLDGAPDVAAKIKETACTDDLGKHPEPSEIPEPEFFNFEAMRSMDMFQVGQVWALYSDAEGLPKHYGLIKEVDQHSEFKLQIAWLKACSLPNESTKWRNAKMPICCGRFKISRSCTYHPYIDSSPFSHQIQAKASKVNVFEIYPRKGEIWALYKNWDLDMKPSDLECCDYEVAEVIDEDDSHTKVSLLEHVAGYNAVFKAQMSRRSLVTREIPHAELMRFSHQIPSHNLSEEKDGSLRGFKELDIYSLPASLWMKGRQQRR